MSMRTLWYGDRGTHLLGTEKSSQSLDNSRIEEGTRSHYQSTHNDVRNIDPASQLTVLTHLKSDASD